MFHTRKLTLKLPCLKNKKGFSKIIRETFHLNQIIYKNYCFVNSKNRLTSTSLAIPAPVGSNLIL